MASFTIPTIYTAVDKFSSPVRNMQRSNASFANSLGSASAMSERAFRKMTPTISEAGKQLMSYASAAAVASGAIAGITFSAKSIMEYEDAVASFRTIVGGTDKEFSPFQKAINDVARDTKRSSIDVAASFEKIAGLNADFAKTAEGISAVSKAAIILSKASRDDLGASAESLVGIMNQYSLGATEANRTINVLAAGQAVGAASIKQTAEAFVNFGSVASGANITLEQSVGLVEAMGKYSLFGAEAGTKLRGSILKLQQAGIGYKSGQFEINDALAEGKAYVDKLRTAKEKDAAVLKMFGAENISTGKILLNNIELYKRYTDSVTGTNEAQNAAKINSETLSAKLKDLGAAWVNMLTGSAVAGSGLNRVKSIISYVTQNLDSLVGATLSVIKYFAIWKVVNIGARVALFAHSVALGINAALQKTSAFAIRGNAVATTTFSIASKIATAATWLWNAALSANPIGLIIAGVAALGAGIYALTKVFKSNTAEERLNNEVKKRALENSIDQRAEASLLFIALRKSAIGSTEFANALKGINALQPGLIEKYNLQAGAIRNIASAERELISTIMKRAEIEARSELLKEKTRSLVEAQNNSPTFSQNVAGFFSGTGGELQKSASIAQQQREIDVLANQIYKSQSIEVLDPNEAKAKAFQKVQTQQAEIKGKIQVDVNTNGKITSGSFDVMPAGSKTW